MFDSTALDTSRDDDSTWVPSRGEADYTSRSGAEALKAKIEAYWRERGLDVMLSLHNVGFHPAIRAARYDVRSDMVNGLPRSNTSKSKPANDAKPVDNFDGDALDVDDVYLD